jgi:hypothetical protein
MATVPFEFECSKESGFVMDPNEHQRVGWVTALDGFGLPAGGLKADLTVSDPMTPPKAGTPAVKLVAGILEKFSWAGGINDPLNLDFYASQENAFQIKALQQTSLRNLAVKAANSTVIDYDQETKAWFTAFAPVQQLSGIITGKEDPQLDVDLNPVLVKDGIDVNVYKITIAISPAANHVYTLKFATSSARSVVKSWGLTSGAQV